MSAHFASNPFYFRVWGDYALFTDPASRGVGEKFTYPVPSYEALKGIASAIYWKPSIILVIDHYLCQDTLYDDLIRALVRSRPHSFEITKKNNLKKNDPAEEHLESDDAAADGSEQNDSETGRSGEAETSEYVLIVMPSPDGENEKGKKRTEKYDLLKTFITFKIQDYDGCRDVSASECVDLHQSYIRYQEDLLARKVQSQGFCNVSGENTYITQLHRGLLGTAKLIGSSDHKETYRGRFQDKTEIMSIGYETSQKIHNMLKYLLENKNSHQPIDDESYLVVWFSGDAMNTEKISPLCGFNPEETTTEEVRTAQDADADADADADFLDLDDFAEATEESEEQSFQAASIYTKLVSEHLAGLRRLEKLDDKIHLLILGKHSEGRLTIKYFRSLKFSEYLQRIEYWYRSMACCFYNTSKKRFVYRTPTPGELVNYLYGIERDKEIVMGNKKFRSMQIARWIPCIIDRQKMPPDMRKVAFTNLCQRHRYPTTWSDIFSLNFGILRKWQFDYSNEEVMNVNGTKKESRSFLFGRLLAVLDYIENAVFQSDRRDEDGVKEKKIRITNAAKYWSSFSRTPARTAKVIMDRIQYSKNKLDSMDTR